MTMETSGPSQRLAALQSGIRLEVITAIWMTLEGAIAISAGVIAGSVLLIAFGLDSVIELISGGVLLWRLSAEAKSDRVTRIENVERRATTISAILLALLCLYVAITTVVGLIGRIEPESSVAGILVSMGALIVMPLLARAKRGVDTRLDSAALRADIAESITCAYMAGTVLVGLALNAALGWWWAEYVAAAVFLYWLVGETREAFEAVRGDEDAE
ncbi:MAG: cation transporter [Chloroflexota bacterium]|nr:cation transporter [Chloroflexota bacterium]